MHESQHGVAGHASLSISMSEETLSEETNEILAWRSASASASAAGLLSKPCSLLHASIPSWGFWVNCSLHVFMTKVNIEGVADDGLSANADELYEILGILAVGAIGSGMRSW